MSDSGGSGDFGKILEDFESEQDAIRGSEKKRAPLIRQEPEPKPETPERLSFDDDGEEDFGAALAAFERQAAGRRGAEKRPQTGDRVSGPILSLDLESALVDIGDKSEAIVRTEDLADEDGALRYEVGDTLAATVVGRDGATGALILRPLDAPSAGGPELTVGEMVEGTITGVNKGGLDVEVGKRRAFCPISQISDRYVEDATEFVGRKLRFEVTRAGGGRRGDLVLSRRVLLERQKEEQAEELRARLEVGATLRGKVTALERYGAFVDLGGIEGMVHVSELSYHRVEHPQDLLEIGQEVEVKVLSIDRDPKGRDRIALSRKALERDPWLDAVGRWHEGATAHGKVRRLESFGAFVELEPGVEGLVHISELGRGRRINHPREVLDKGQTLAVRVLKLDTERQRISLQPVDDGELDASEPSVREILDAHRAERSGAKGGGKGVAARDGGSLGGSLGSMAHFFDKARGDKND